MRRKARNRMNHDNAHCIDYTDNCPKECYRGALVRDLKLHQIVTWTHFKGTAECVIGKVVESEET